MKNIKSTLIIALSVLLSFTVSVQTASAQFGLNEVDPAGTLAYSLPKTTISLEVTAVMEQYYAGPYAKYASKYLGIDVRTTDRTTYQIAEVKMTPFIEADQTKRFSIAPGNDTKTFLQLTSQGLVSISDGFNDNSSHWRFPKAGQSDFNDKGITSNLTSEAATLYTKSNSKASYNKIAVQQNMVVSKSLEQRAREAANMIFSLRRKRVQIITGDTDATFSGEAMGAVIEEISKLEKEYMTLFTGYSEYQTETKKFDVIPDSSQDMQVYIAFRLSDKTGLVSADDVAGKPYMLELFPEKIAVSEGDDVKLAKNTAIAYYRIPAVCTVRLSDGMNTLLKDRIPVYQLGRVSTLPLKTK